jgi:predicted ATPase/transcriptional regulator with XRE-family HTH domain
MAGMDENFSFGYWLRRQRLARDLRQNDLAAQLGVATVTLRKLEADERRPSLQLIARVAEIFGLSDTERETLQKVARADLSPAALPLSERASDVTPHATAPHSRINLQHQLPTPPNPLIGREADLTAIALLLGTPALRLLTLLGPGGIGKTRLAIAAAHEQMGRFPDGVWFVDLSPIREPGLVLPKIAHTLGLAEQSNQPLREQLADYLRDRTLLLVLDNCEQVIAAMVELADLLTAAPQLHLLITSREALRLAGEQIYQVHPLALPADTGNDLLNSSAAQLCIARARAARNDLVIDATTTSAIVTICRRLDGLPLAIELAAARARLLPLPALAARLEHPLGLLTSGSRDLPTRQQTLRATIAWSYDLLNDAEQALFRRLGVFAGGWDLAAAEAVGELGLETLDLLSGLIDKSLVRQGAGTGDEPRYGILETIRTYALEQLAATGEDAATSERHAAYYLELAEARAPALNSAQELAISAAWEVDHDNLRAALGWYTANNNHHALARMCIAIWPFWWLRQHFREGYHRLLHALENRASLPEQCVRRLLIAAGIFASAMSEYADARHFFQQARQLSAHDEVVGDTTDLYLGLGGVSYGESNYTQAVEYVRAALTLSRRQDDHWHTATGLTQLAIFLIIQDDLDTATTTAHEALVLSRTIGADFWEAMSCFALARIAVSRGNHSDAVPLLEEAYEVFTRHQIWSGLSDVGNYRGQVAFAQKDFALASDLFAECFTLRRNLGDRRGCIAPLARLADALREQGEFAQAREHIGEALRIAQAIDYTEGICWAIDALARLLCDDQAAEQAARFLGLEASVRETAGLSIWPEDRPLHDQGIARARAALGEEAFAAAFAAGRALPVEQAVAEAQAWIATAQHRRGAANALEANQALNKRQ